jgi:hypothetical protein
LHQQSVAGGGEGRPQPAEEESGFFGGSADLGRFRLPRGNSKVMAFAPQPSQSFSQAGRKEAAVSAPARRTPMVPVYTSGACSRTISPFPP